MRGILAVVLMLAVQGESAADFLAGYAAYQRGNYVTAIREYQKSAEQAQIDAQYTLACRKTLIRNS